MDTVCLLKERSSPHQQIQLCGLDHDFAMDFILFDIFPEKFNAVNDK